MIMTNQDIDTLVISETILRDAKHNTVESIVEELRKPIGTANYNTFFQALEAYVTCSNAERYLSRLSWKS
jgi:hypothetical protein